MRSLWIVSVLFLWLLPGTAQVFAAFVPPFSNDDRPAGLQSLSDNRHELERDCDGQPRLPNGTIGAFGG